MPRIEYGNGNWLQYEIGDWLELGAIVQDNSVDLVLTDPPYNINLQPQRKVNDPIINDNMSRDEFASWFHMCISEMNRCLKNNRYGIIFTGWSSISLFEGVLAHFWEIKRVMVWVKNNWGIGYYVRPQHEMMFLVFKGTPQPPESPPSDVWYYDKVLNPIHSCQKPVKLLKNLITAFSQPGDVVLDPFLGSGSTLRACRETQRNGVGFEIDTKHNTTIKNTIMLHTKDILTYEG